jgi:hypothetical protein
VPGPEPGTGCTACEHEHVTQINALVNDGRLSNRQIGRQFGLGKDVVSRHVFKRHPGVAVGAPAAPTGDPATDDGRTELQRLEDIRVALEKELNRSPRADISRELRQVNQRIAEIRGTDRPREVAVTDVEGLPEAMFLATDRELLEAAGVEA